MAVAVVAALCASSASAAEVFKFPGNLPATCAANPIGSTTSFSCPNLKLVWNDSIEVINANTTLTVGNTFTANGNEVNTSSPASGFAIIAKTVKADNYIHLVGTLSATGDLATEWGSTITGNVSAKSITSGGSSIYGGNLTATNGDISGGSSDTIGGTVTATGKLTTKSATTITGNVSAKSIVSGGGSTYSGSLTATGGNIDGGSSDTIGGTVTASGVLTTGWSTIIGGNVSAKSIVSGGGSTYGGNLTATNGDITGASNDTFGGTVTASGALTTGSSTTIAGNVSAKSITSGGGSTYSGSLTATGGDITSGSADKIAGSVTASAGKVTLNSSNTTVGGSIVASGDIILSSQSSVTGDVTSGQGRVTLKSSGTKVNGSVFSWNQATLESGTQVVGSVISYNDNVVLDSSNASVGQCVTAPGSKSIKLGWNATVGGICCDTGGTCSNACLNDLSGNPTPALCSKPATCIVDNLSSGTLDPGLWNALAISGSFVPAVVDVGGQKRLRMTTAVTYQSTMVQLKKWFPGAGNKITVEFNYYVYGGNGADGVTVVFSDANVAAAAGGYGGSLGYAQRSVISGFAGGWLAVGLDEFGNFPNPTEGRTGYPTGWTSVPGGIKVAAGAYKNNVSVRGSGNAQSGYNLLANTGTLSPVLWQSSSSASTLQRFRITIDHSNGVNAYVKVERDTSGTGTSYVTVVPAFDAKAAPGQAAVPENWLVSFTGSTGGSTNIHELSLLSICAPHVTPPGGSTSAGGFACLEQGANTPWVSTARKPLYTKLVGTDFKLDIAALKTDGSGALETDYITSGGDSKYLRVELFDDTTPAASCADYTSLVAAQTVTVASGLFSGGRIPTTSSFNLPTAYKKLICRVRECTSSSCATFTTTVPAGCSTPEQFSVRPHAFAIDTSATNAASSGEPVFKAGRDVFKLDVKAKRYDLTAASAPTLAALIDVGGYTGSPKIGTIDTAPMGIGTWVGGSLSTGATLATAVAGVSTNAPTYSEVGLFKLAGYAPTTVNFAGEDNTSARGTYDDDWIKVDSDNKDCVIGSYSNKPINGKYGCNFGLVADQAFGRFIPDHFVVTPGAATPACGTFTYFGQDGFTTPFTLTAQNAANATTQNYTGDFAKLVLSNWSNFVFTASPSPLAGSTLAASATPPSGTWTNGVAVVSARHQVSRPPPPPPPALPAGETAVTVLAKPVDLDGVTVATASAVQTASTPLRFGRLKLDNNYGSELLDLTLSLQSQYSDGTSWVLNKEDVCTNAALTAPTAKDGVALSGYSAPTGAPTPVSVTNFGPTHVEGFTPDGAATWKLTMKKPSPAATGSVDVCLDLGPDPTTGIVCAASTSLNLPWLQSLSPGSTYDNDPVAKVTFGVYRSLRKLIHRREVF